MVFSNHSNTGLDLNIKNIRADLENIRKLRNRIFHHEPIVNLVFSAEALHNLIYFYLESMAPDIVEDIKGVDSFQETTFRSNSHSNLENKLKNLRI